MAGIDKKISPHKLRHTYATNILNAGAERLYIKALLGYKSSADTVLEPIRKLTCCFKCKVSVYFS